MEASIDRGTGDGLSFFEAPLEAFCDSVVQNWWKDDADLEREYLGCGVERLDHPDLRLLTVLEDGDEYLFLIAREGDAWSPLQTMGYLPGGRGNMSSWIERIRVARLGESETDGLAVDFLAGHVDWDVGIDAYSESAECRRLECRKRLSGPWTCTAPKTLWAYGGNYGVVRDDLAPNNFPYRVGAPEEQWDCRDSEVAPPHQEHR